MSASMSVALKCEVLPCVSLITWMWFVASAGLIFAIKTSVRFKFGTGNAASARGRKIAARVGR